MKRFLFSLTMGVTGLALTGSVFAQTHRNPYKYSAYGIHLQQEQQEQHAAPGDVPLPPALYADPADSAVVDRPVWHDPLPNAGIVGANLIHSNTANRTVGVRGLVFARDLEYARMLGTNAQGDCLCTTDVKEDAAGGFETFLGVRKCNGLGWEAGYWGLFPGDASTRFGGPPLTTALGGLSQLDLGGQRADVVFNGADYWEAGRFNEFHSLELNLLRSAGTTRGFCGSCVSIEWLAGIRGFKFEEDFQYASFTDGGTPRQAIYNVGADNQLLGFQLGARANRYLGNTLSVSLGVKWGIYNNWIETNQNLADGSGNPATINSGASAGADYNFAANKNDVATLGELDLGLNWDFTSCCRATVGYRAVGVTGIALAPGQIPLNFSDVTEILDINNSGDLMLHGAYFGIEYAF